MQQLIETMVSQALAEDHAHEDITAALMPDDAIVTAKLITRDAAVLCGQEWASLCFAKLSPAISATWQFRDGELLAADSVVLELEGPAAAILAAERSAINFLQTLSATATITNQYVKTISHTNCRILDSRKTIPLWRHAQKYAVTVGGGHNHRLDLNAAYLIKENHIAAYGSIPAVVQAARQAQPNKFLEIEVESLAEFAQAVAAKVDRIMLDNFSLTDISAAVNEDCGIPLEASGNITLANIADYAETGIDYISVGALTKNIAAVDFSLRF